MEAASLDHRIIRKITVHTELHYVEEQCNVSNTVCNTAAVKSDYAVQTAGVD